MFNFKVFNQMTTLFARLVSAKWVSVLMVSFAFTAAVALADEVDTDLKLANKAFGVRIKRVELGNVFKLRTAKTVNLKWSDGRVLEKHCSVLFYLLSQGSDQTRQELITQFFRANSNSQVTEYFNSNLILGLNFKGSSAAFVEVYKFMVEKTSEKFADDFKIATWMFLLTGNHYKTLMKLDLLGFFDEKNFATLVEKAVEELGEKNNVSEVSMFLKNLVLCHTDMSDDKALPGKPKTIPTQEMNFKKRNVAILLTQGIAAKYFKTDREKFVRCIKLLNTVLHELVESNQPAVGGSAEVAVQPSAQVAIPASQSAPLVTRAVIPARKLEQPTIVPAQPSPIVMQLTSEPASPQPMIAVAQEESRKRVLNEEERPLALATVSQMKKSRIDQLENSKPKGVANAIKFKVPDSSIMEMIRNPRCGTPSQCKFENNLNFPASLFMVLWDRISLFKQFLAWNSKEALLDEIFEDGKTIREVIFEHLLSKGKFADLGDLLTLQEFCPSLEIKSQLLQKVVQAYLENQINEEAFVSFVQTDGLFEGRSAEAQTRELSEIFDQLINKVVQGRNSKLLKVVLSKSWFIAQADVPQLVKRHWDKAVENGEKDPSGFEFWMNIAGEYFDLNDI